MTLPNYDTWKTNALEEAGDDALDAYDEYVASLTEDEDPDDPQEWIERWLDDQEEEAIYRRLEDRTEGYRI